LGALVPGPLPRCVIRVGMGGMPLKVFDPLLGSELSLEFFSLVVGNFSLVASLAATAPGVSELRPCLVTSWNKSARRGRGREFFGST